MVRLGVGGTVLERLRSILGSEELGQLRRSYHVRILDMLDTRCRSKTVAACRQKCMYLLRERGFSYPEIGAILGGLNHTSVMYGVTAHCLRHGLPPPAGTRLMRTKYVRKVLPDGTINPAYAPEGT